MKFVYIQHIDWDWLPQRPHFLALELKKLSVLNPMEIYFISAVDRKNLRKSKIGNLDLETRALRGTPYWNRFGFRYLSKLRLTQDLRKIKDLKNAHVYITHPRLFQALENLEVGKLTYDCMDDAIAMAGNNGKYVGELERKLCARADHLIVSSRALQNILLTRYNKTSTLVRNGINSKGFLDGVYLRKDFHTNNGPKRAIFFGVIGDWIDQEKLISISQTSGWILELYGPIDVKLNQSLEPFYKGTLSQSDLHRAVSNADLALLPFKKNDFTETIDPVKMYEYVGLHLPILATPLSVLQDFENLFIPWDDSKELSGLLKFAQEIYPQFESLRVSLLEASSWEIRASQLISVIGEQ